MRKTATRNQLPVDEITEVRVLDPYFYAWSKGESAMRKSIKRLAIVATLLAAAIIPSVASARPILPDREPYSDAAAAVEAATPTPVQHAAAIPASGFRWHDAAFGAAGMLVLVGVGSGTVLVVRRRAILS